MKNNPLSFIADKIEQNLPEALRPLHAEMKKTARRVAEAPFEKLDLVPKSEFERQSEELQALKARIAALEAQLATHPQHAR